MLFIRTTREGFSDQNVKQFRNGFESVIVVSLNDDKNWFIDFSRGNGNHRNPSFVMDDFQLDLNWIPKRGAAANSPSQTLLNYTVTVQHSANISLDFETGEWWLLKIFSHRIPNAIHHPALFSRTDDFEGAWFH
ncbi:hypothetical protein CfE428DRAFT_0062 [Chthoniobacter flavus Ellin428]|uniref:Uncharacterized protein n=1 Tax=Chthoniobacter flavus Ellin428 TaxID=497964 RepID=B4CTP1_9BACT|nr:hypothetical protein CfE428DRAFT_0062 [Chthoniobacter flavus Ellin428]TCO89327.1 hypothetical protein EV701_11461 [Chthoniobacter flavus]